ncbi:MAG: cytochrome c biogenesis heme-transporting ATPase CcmA [Rhodocyclaceae bacterium]|nr:cytochrome c biogenesis heme-transporting ATPase CcmA [Rhodocyclaceae bacterium]
MLEIRDLSCVRGDRLLFADLDLSVGPGERVRLLGPNGVGKTTLLRCLCGLIEPEDGEIRWNGQSIHGAREDFHRQLLYIGHSAALNDLLTPLENLRFTCRAGTDRVAEQACVEALERIGLGAQLDLPCRALSQGQRRRVGLARLFLAGERRLWVLDEPFNALDVAAVADLASSLDAHCARGGLVVLTTHQDVSFAHPGRVVDLGGHAC